MNVWIVCENKLNYLALEKYADISFFNSYEEFECAYKSSFHADFVIYEEEVSGISFGEFLLTSGNTTLVRKNNFIIVMKTDCYDQAFFYYQLGATQVHCEPISTNLLMATIEHFRNADLDSELK